MSRVFGFLAIAILGILLATMVSMATSMISDEVHRERVRSAAEAMSGDVVARDCLYVAQRRLTSDYFGQLSMDLLVEDGTGLCRHGEGPSDPDLRVRAHCVMRDSSGHVVGATDGTATLPVGEATWVSLEDYLQRIPAASYRCTVGLDHG